MEADLLGRIANTRLPSHQALLPLFEAVVNAIHSCNDVHSSGDLSIKIKILRETAQGIMEGSGIQNPVESFEITDEGLGFTDENYRSFETADSRHRASIGGKGVGRFLWLVAFERAEIESAFQAEDGSWMRRTFIFRSTPRGTEEHKLEPTNAAHRLTTISLIRVKDRYQKNLPKQANVVAKRIVEHCLEYFLLGMNARISVVDKDSNEAIDLNALFNEQIEARGTSAQLELGKRTFRVHHLRVRPTYGEGHRLYFCANKRLVKSERLDGKIPNLDVSIKDLDGKLFVYSGYVSGQYLDENVNAERTGFNLDETASYIDDLTWTDLVNGTAELSKQYLEPYTAPIKSQKEARIREFVRSKQPGFRPLIKHRPEILDSIPASITDERLELELYRLNQDYERSLKEKGEQLVAKMASLDGRINENTYDSFLEEWNESGIAKLANHVAYRKATLKILKASLGLNRNAKYSLEEAVHKLIFPLRKTSDDVPADQMNLWIIDEKLAYHFYLASDIPFSALQKDVVDVDSAKRADIVIFNQASAFVEEEAPFSAVVIVEFKRPMRDDYTDDDNPIIQIYRYIKLIREGRATDRAGRIIAVKKDIPFYAYIIADLTPALKDQAQFSGFQSNHDGTGYFTFNTQLLAYVELISFDNLIANAERRNQYFFDQLNIPM